MQSESGSVRADIASDLIFDTIMVPSTRQIASSGNWVGVYYLSTY